MTHSGSIAEDRLTGPVSFCLSVWQTVGALVTLSAVASSRLQSLEVEYLARVTDPFRSAFSGAWSQPLLNIFAAEKGASGSSPHQLAPSSAAEGCYVGRE
jgi:hypothetical protein